MASSRPFFLRVSSVLLSVLLLLSPLAARFSRAQETVTVGGFFDVAGGVAATNIANWDGARWSDAGERLRIGTGFVRTLVVYNGALVVAGRFETAGAVSDANSIAALDEATGTWTGFAGGVQDFYADTIGDIYASTVFRGNLVIGGLFTSAGGVDCNDVAQWDGTAWSNLAGGVSNYALAFTEYEGDLVVGGSFVFADAGDIIVSGIARWDGAAWSRIGQGIANQSTISALTVYGGRLIAGGDFETASGVPANRIAQWDGTAWSALGEGVGGPRSPQIPSVLAFAQLNGALIVGGRFTTAGGQLADRMAFWNGTAWAPIGGGVNNQVDAVAVHNGNILAAGNFNVADGVEAILIAQWDGTAWSSLDFQDQWNNYELISAMLVRPTIAAT